MGAVIMSKDMRGSSGVFYDVGGGKSLQDLAAAFAAIDGEVLELMRAGCLKLSAEPGRVHLLFFPVGADFNYPKAAQVRQVIGRRGILHAEAEDAFRIPSLAGISQASEIHFFGQDPLIVEEFGEPGHLVVSPVEGKFRLGMQWDKYPPTPDALYAAREPRPWEGEGASS
jgi:hypothetical protein